MMTKNANPLQKSNTCAILIDNTAAAQQPQATDFWKLYLQERKRALMTELRMIEQLQATMKGQHT